MAPPKRKAGGRTTPKGTKPGSAARLPTAPAPSTTSGPRATNTPSSRYTPPVPRSVKQSAPWVPYLMFGLLIAGAVAIVLNYLELLPGAASNWYLLGGLGAILAGIVVATQYR
jgi:hypothetical protein